MRETHKPWPSRTGPTVRRSSTPSASKQKSADKRRGFAIVGVCITIAVLLIGAALIKPVGDWWTLRSYENKDLDAIGAKADACGEVTTKKANGEQDHVEPGTPIPYEDSPPAFGQHYDQPDAMDRKLYTDVGPPRPRHARAQPRARLHGPVVRQDRRRQRLDDGRPARHRLEAPGHQQPARQVQGRAVDLRGRRGLPRWPARGPHPLVHRWRGRDRQGEAGRRLPVLLGSQRCRLEEFMEQYPYLDSPEPLGV